MKRTLIIVIALTLLVAAAAIAGPQGRQRPGTPATPAHGGGEMLGPAALAEFLGLSDAQQEAAAALRESFRATVQPIHEELRAMREEIEEAVAAGNATKAGELLIASKTLRDQLKAARENLETQFEALLTTEQKAKWEILQELRELRGRGPGEGERGPRF
jgi:Spy/CpxP family protein refolding chaperone